MVYVDLLLIANFLLDFCILTLTGIICKEKLCLRRLVISALVASSSVSLFWISSTIAFIILRFMYSLIIVFLAYSFRGIKKFVIDFSIFYIMNYVLAGVLISFNLSSKFLVIDFFDLKIWCFLIISFLFSLVLTYVLKVQLIQKQFSIPVQIKIGGKWYELLGYLDSGNTVLTPNQIPVVFIDDNSIDFVIDEMYLQANAIPYQYTRMQTLYSEHEILVFQPEEFKIYYHHDFIPVMVYLALFNQASKSDYQVILNKNLLF